MVFLMLGCGLNMEKNYRRFRPQLLDQNYDGANKYLDDVKADFYSKDNALLFYMDKAMVLHLGKHFTESNEILEKAKTKAQELWTESIGKNAMSWIATDNSLPYQGEDFEKVLLHFVGALNYIGLKNYEAARVEARQLTEKLELYNSKYTENKNAYKDDAFARWLSGKLSETEGGESALNDAWIDYKKSIDVYTTDYAKRYATPLPSIVVTDALRVTDGLGASFKEEHDAVKNRFPTAAYVTQTDAAKQGEVVFIHMCGEAPYKRDVFWQADKTGRPMVLAAPHCVIADNSICVAHPEFIAKPHFIKGARMTLRGTGTAVQTELAENLTGIAIQNLNDHMGRIVGKAIARAVAKFVASQAAQVGGAALANKGGNAGAAGNALQVAGWLYGVSTSATEEADKRSWITLPADVWVGRMFVPPGHFDLDVEFTGPGGGQVLESIQLSGEAVAGKTLFYSYRTYR